MNQNQLTGISMIIEYKQSSHKSRLCVEISQNLHTYRDAKINKTKMYSLCYSA